MPPVPFGWSNQLAGIDDVRVVGRRLDDVVVGAWRGAVVLDVVGAGLGRPWWKHCPARRCRRTILRTRAGLALFHRIQSNPENRVVPWSARCAIAIQGTGSRSQ